MSKNYKNRLSLFLLLMIAQFSVAQELVHYWNFNNNTSEAAITTPTFSAVAGASLSAIAGGESIIDFAGGTGQNFNVLNLNARNGDAFGSHLRFNLPIGGALEFALPTTGFEDIIVKFATRRSGSGAGNQLWSYSVNGTDYISFQTVAPNNGDPGLATLDFTAITAANDNPNFKLKVEFEAGSGGIEGNNRFDNFTLDATSTAGDTTPPTVTIAPADIPNIPVDVVITVGFNEAVRLVNDDPIDDTNVDALVELRLDDASGALVPFDAVFAANTISITPTSDLSNGQTYYVELLPNTVEDLSDNAVIASISSSFTTIAIQPEFGAGDMAFVGYRMSATGTEDQVAIITFVDISEGTTINLTDSKYTTNAQPQCPQGIVWTSNQCIPAGSVFTIQTSALVSDKGIVTGTGFGLSSNGDQVIVYTGTAAAPNYITALTSINWIATNTDCGGSLSMIPAGLADGVTAINTSTAPGNVAGNTPNAFYSGTQTGTTAALKTAILDAANWTGVAGSTAPQVWPTWGFPQSLQVESVSILNNTTIEVIFTKDINAVSGADVANYTGVPNLASVAVSDNVATLTYSEALETGTYNLVISNVEDEDDGAMPCPFTFEFDASLALPEFGQTAFMMYPNPSNNGIVNFNVPADISVFDFTGKMVYQAKEASSIDTASFASGMYLVRTADGAARKLIVN